MAIHASIIFTDDAKAARADIIRGSDIETLHAVASLMSYYGPTPIPAAAATEMVDRLSSVLAGLLIHEAGEEERKLLAAIGDFQQTRDGF